MKGMKTLQRLGILLLLVTLAAGGSYVLWVLTTWGPFFLVGQSTTEAKPGEIAGKKTAPSHDSPDSGKVIRVATFYPGPIEGPRLQDPSFVKVLQAVIRQCDVIAVHGFRGAGRGPFMPFFDSLRKDRSIRYLVSEPLRDHTVRQFSVIFYDESKVILDRRRSGPVEDPARVFRWRPLVASFAAAEVPLEQAFTFTVVAARVDPLRVSHELEMLSALLRTVASQHAPEDDILLLAHLEADEETVLQTFRPFIPAVSGVPNSARGTRLASNILFDPRATCEFTGQSGVVSWDVLLGQAAEVAPPDVLFLPVWAEFSIGEGVNLELFTALLRSEGVPGVVFPAGCVLRPKNGCPGRRMSPLFGLF
jgi:hypothetical protein